MTDNQKNQPDERAAAQAPAEGPDSAAPETQPTGKDERHHSTAPAEGARKEG